MYLICNSCNAGTSSLPDMYARGPQAQGLRAYISGKARVPVIQLICYTFGTLKSAQSLMTTARSIYILKGVRCDCGTLF